MINWSEIEFFTRDEFKYHGDIEPDPELVRKLDSARRSATQRAGRDVVFSISSGIRAPRRRQNGDQLDSAHATGHAVDIRARNSRDRFYILEAVLMAGFNRIGIYDLHIHVDTSQAHDPDVAWVGRSE